MKQKLSTPALASILVLSAGFVFPLLFGFTDILLRRLLHEIDPTLLLGLSFSWLLLFYFFGIKFSLEYLTRQFEIGEKERLFTYANVGFAAVSLLFYASLLSASLLSNMIWGCFYLCTIAFFYCLSSKYLKKL